MSTRSEIANHARSLLKDAELLLVADRYRSAVALAITSIEEVGKILAEAQGRAIQRSGGNLHKQKQRSVGVLISLQVCLLSIGKNFTIPREGEPPETVDPTLDRLITIIETQEGVNVGKELAACLWSLGGGRVDTSAFDRVADYRDWLLFGRLHTLKAAALYEDDETRDVRQSIDAELAAQVMELARMTVRMCDRL